MAVKTEKELSETQRSHWLKSIAAVELRNFGYAISLLQGILKQEPEFLTGRQLLRRTEVTKSKAAKKSILNISTAPIAVMKAQREIKKDPKRAVELLEEVFTTEPLNKQANLALREAAVTAGWPEIAVFALETLLEENPSDVKLLHEMGRLLRSLGESEREVELYERISEINPRDAEALQLGKNAAARASMKSGRWTEATSYRDLIRDKEVAVSPVQQSPVKLTGESLDQRIAETYARQQTDPQNVDLARQLGGMNEEKQDFESALAWYEYASDLTNDVDTGLVRKISDVKMKRLDRKIAHHEEFLASHSLDDALRAQVVQELNTSKQERAEVLIAETRHRIAQNPIDVQLRFELGEHLIEAGQFREALPELQKARQNPNARLNALNLLGRCYSELGMLDLAMKQLEEASGEISTMDAIKKAIVYDLGLVYERMGERDKSLNCMKQIYQVDYGYKDVAQRVESSYHR
jgi:tetratricopeptide (TPR) repeat protein